MTLELYYYDECPFCARVLAALRDLGISSVTMRNTRRDPRNREALLALTGRTQVPCLAIDGRPMLESADIVAWLRANRDRLAAGTA